MTKIPIRHLGTTERFSKLDMEISTESNENIESLKNESFEDEPSLEDPNLDEPQPADQEEQIDLDVANMGWDELCYSFYKKGIEAGSKKVPELNEVHDEETYDTTGKILGAIARKNVGNVDASENLELYAAIFIGGNIGIAFLKNWVQSGGNPTEKVESVEEPENNSSPVVSKDPTEI